MIHCLFQHPDYDYTLGYPDDVAVLELTQDVEYNDRVKYMVLARGSSLWNYAPCTLTGWGNAGQGSYNNTNHYNFIVGLLSTELKHSGVYNRIVKYTSAQIY